MMDTTKPCKVPKTAPVDIPVTLEQVWSLLCSISEEIALIRAEVMPETESEDEDYYPGMDEDETLSLAQSSQDVPWPRKKRSL